MSPTKSCPRSVSAQTEQQSTHAPAAGADGDLRPDRAAEPPTSGIESNAREPGSSRSLSHEFTPSEPAEGHWIDHVDALNFKVEQLKALANAMFCIAHCEFDFFLTNKEAEDPAADEQLLPLSLLSQRLCDEVDAHVDALYRHLRTYSKEAQADLDDILEKRAQLDPEAQSFIDEVAHILSVATPAEKAILALGIEGVKQKAQQRKATHASARSSTEGKNGVTGPR